MERRKGRKLIRLSDGTQFKEAQVASRIAAEISTPARLEHHRASIEAHPRVPQDDASREWRPALHRFLMNQARRHDPEFPLRWRRFRDWVSADPPNCLRELYDLIHTALYMLKEDHEHAELKELARRALPGKRKRTRLAAAGEAVALLARTIPDEADPDHPDLLTRRERFLNIHVAKRRLPDAPGPMPMRSTLTLMGRRIMANEPKQVVTLGDLLANADRIELLRLAGGTLGGAKGKSKLMPGSGAPEVVDTVTEELLRFFRGSEQELRMSTHSAVELTLDVWKGFLGRKLEREALLWRLKQLERPRRARPRPS